LEGQMGIPVFEKFPLIFLARMGVLLGS